MRGCAVTRGTLGTGRGCLWPTLCRSSGWRTQRWDKASLCLSPWCSNWPRYVLSVLPFNFSKTATLDNIQERELWSCFHSTKNQNYVSRQTKFSFKHYCCNGQWAQQWDCLYYCYDPKYLSYPYYVAWVRLYQRIRLNTFSFVMG